ncbi:hypothetical protein EVAR_68543_1 [Eumeta japonica]|uniref:Uncharacterized protein n=1 Tax=Eumeta variegata TaxID=151549 RepID=A0A4C1ZVG7_EUMVA|nr:hypothetical protein EVAR_68543_1 [Eumeta japonica]
MRTQRRNKHLCAAVLRSGVQYWPQDIARSHFYLSSKSAFTTTNNAPRGTEQKWAANKENNKIRIRKHIKAGGPERSRDGRRLRHRRLAAGTLL